MRSIMNNTVSKRIGLISDTHGVVPCQVYSFFEQCDEIWHCGDLGVGVLEELERWKPLRAVYGNIDDQAVRHRLQETLLFECGGMKVMMTHIGGWPEHYSPEIRQKLEVAKPDIFVCGHSHILKVMYDKSLNLLHVNPGAAGRSGWHKRCTLVRMEIDGEVKGLEICQWDR